MKARFFYLLVTQSLIFSCYQTFGQNYAVYNSYSVNPYLYNPAEAASDHTFLFLNHRRQWNGIPGAPVLSTINISTLIDQSRVGVGFKASSYNRGILTTTDAQATFAYGIPVGKEDAFYFGMSGGLISNGIDQSKVTDPSDPAIANYLANNIQPVGSAGFVYKSGSGINFGVSLPQFIGQKTVNGIISPTSSITPLNQVFITMYYRKKVESRITSRKVRGVRTRSKTEAGYAPLELYTVYKYSAYQTSQFEATAKLNLSDKFWVGAGYRQAYGVIGHVGFAIDNFLINYSYEPGSQPQSGFSSGTHEIQLGVRFGKEKHLKRKAPVLQSTLQATQAEHRATRLRHSVSDPDEEERKEQQKEGQPRKQYLVVIRVFGDFLQAEDFKKKLIAQKFNADIYFNPKDKKYYVHVLKTAKAHEANEEAKNLRNYTKLKDAKVVMFEDK